jgi:hypothetical protein
MPISAVPSSCQWYWQAAEVKATIGLSGASRDFSATLTPPGYLCGPLQGHNVDRNVGPSWKAGGGHGGDAELGRGSVGESELRSNVGYGRGYRQADRHAGGAIRPYSALPAHHGEYKGDLTRVDCPPVHHSALRSGVGPHNTASSRRHADSWTTPQRSSTAHTSPCTAFGGHSNCVPAESAGPSSIVRPFENWSGKTRRSEYGGRNPLNACVEERSVVVVSEGCQTVERGSTSATQDPRELEQRCLGGHLSCKSVEGLSSTQRNRNGGHKQVSPTNSGRGEDFETAVGMSVRNKIDENRLVERSVPWQANEGASVSGNVRRNSGGPWTSEDGGGDIHGPQPGGGNSGGLTARYGPGRDEFEGFGRLGGRPVEVATGVVPPESALHDVSSLSVRTSATCFKSLDIALR